MKSYLRLLAFTFPVVACGGQVFLDNAPTSTGKTDDGGAPKLDGGAPIDSATTPSPICSSSPEAIATLNGDLDHVDSIVVNDTNLAYTASNLLAPDPVGPLQRALHAVKLDTGSDRLLVGANPALEALSSSIGIIGSDVYYRVGTALPQDGFGPREVLRVALAGGTPTYPFAQRVNTSYDEIAAAPNGVLYGYAESVVGVPPHAWWSWREGSTSESVSIAPSALSNLVAFNGGFAAIAPSSDKVYVALEATKAASVGHATSNGRRVKKVRAARDGSSNFVALYALEDPGDLGLSEERIIQSDCTIDVASGIKACPEAKPTPVFSVFAGTILRDFEIRDDRTFVVIQTLTNGVRPASQIVWVKDKTVEPIGGEGITGTVDHITALATRGNCIYWAERGTGGSRIMRVRR